MKRKLMPPFMMLFAGSIASIVMYLNHYEIKSMLWILVAVLIIFYIVGVLIKMILDSFYRELEKVNAVADEGEVIEKDMAEDVTEAAISETDPGQKNTGEE